MGWPAWRMVLKRTWVESGSDNIGLVAAGVAFYGFLSIVPALGAILLTYGLVASPETLIHTIVAVSHRLPENAASMIEQQIVGLVQAPSSSKGWGLVGALLIAIYGATKGIDGLITAISIAYDQEDKRGFLRRTGVVLALTLFTVTFALVALVAISLLGSLGDIPFIAGAGSAILLVVAGSFAAAIFYRFGPDRENARWTWLTPGALLSALLWLIATALFALYVSKVDDYGATWGSLAGVVVLLTWLYLNAYILLIGAELNAELEHQTSVDSTTGPDCPLGKRGAFVADEVAGQPG